MDYFLRIVEQNPESIRNINRLRIMYEPDKIDPTGYLDYLKLASIALSKNGLLFEYVKEELTNNDYVRLAGIAIMNNLEAIRFVEKNRTDLKIDENGAEIDPFSSFDLGEDNSKEIPYFDELEYYVKVAKDPRYIEYLPTELHHYKDIIMAAMQQDGFSLKYVPSEKIDKEIVLSAVRNNVKALDYVPDELIDKEIALATVQQSGSALYYIPKKLIDKEIALIAVQQNGESVQYVPKELIDKEIALIAVKQKGESIQYFPKEIIDKEIALTAVQQYGYAIQFIPEKIIDKDVALAAVQQDGNIIKLGYIPKTIDGYEDVIMAGLTKICGLLPGTASEKDIVKKAVNKSVWLVEFVPERLLDKDLALAAVNKNGYIIQSIPQNIEGYDQILMEALKKIGRTDANVTDLKEIALAAVQEDGDILKYVPKNIEGYNQLIIEALKQIGGTGADVTDLKEIAYAAVQQNVEALSYVPKELIDKEIVDLAFSKDRFSILYIPTSIDGYIEMAVEAVMYHHFLAKTLSEIMDDSKEFEIRVVEAIINYYHTSRISQSYDDYVLNVLVNECKYSELNAKEILNNYHEYLDNNQEKTI